MKLVKKITALAVSSLMMFSMAGMNVFAASTTQDGLEVSLTTDKESYAKDEKITATLSVKNTNESDVTDIAMETVIPDGYEVTDGTKNNKQFDKLAPNESAELKVVYVAKDSGKDSQDSEVSQVSEESEISQVSQKSQNSEISTVSPSNDSPKTGDNAIIPVAIALVMFVSVLLAVLCFKSKKGRKLLSVILTVSIIGGTSALITIRTNAVENDQTISIETSFNADGTTVTLNGTVTYELVNGEFSLEKFKASVYDIYVDKTESVLFSVEVIPSGARLPSEVKVLDQNNSFITNLNDDGLYGDKTAGDGLYSSLVDLSSSEIEVVKYYAECGEKRSNYFEICYYQDITQDDFVAYAKLLSTINDLSFEDAKKFISSSSEIIDYQIDDQHKTISYKSIYGISGIWEDQIEGTKANGTYSVPTSSGVDYRVVDEKIETLTIIPQRKYKEIAVLRPFHGTEFPYDDFLEAGNALGSALSAKTTITDDNDVTLSYMKSLDKYDIVLIDSHGLITSDKKNYIVSGESFDEEKFLWDVGYYLERVGYSADYLSGRIVGTSKNRAAVNSKFFDKYYTDNSLDKSFWFLGTCYSLYNDTIADVLITKGTSTVMGYTDTVNVTYCNNTLFESVINEMLLSAGTSESGFISATRVYGTVDPSNSLCRFEYRGKNDYKIVKEVKKEQTVISGTVKAENGSILNDVKVTLTDNEGNTYGSKFTKNGKYSFDIDYRKSRRYTVTFEKSGYKTKSISETEGGTKITINAELDFLLHVSGTITDVNGNSINDVSITLTDSEGNNYGTINGSGSYSFGVKEEHKTYTLTFEKEGYVTQTKTIIDVAEDRTVNVKLKKEEIIPDDATVFNGHSYHIYSNFTWEEAEAYCESVGGHLVTITSQEEMDFITNELMNNKTNENCYWIGLQRDGDSWKWVTGEEFSYQNWAANEPNNYKNKGENYVHLFGKEYTEGNGTKLVGTWNDVTNEGASYAADFYALSNFGYICEWDTVNSNSNRNMYAQYFTIEPVVSDYGPNIVDEYGARLVVNDGAKIRKCAMYMKQVDGVWKRTMAFVGDNITSAKYSPYVAYQGTILYDGYNNSYINLINMYQSTDGIWSINGNFRIVEADLEDNNGNHLTLRSTSVVGNNVQIFDDLDQMKEWLLS